MVCDAMVCVNGVYRDGVCRWALTQPHTHTLCARACVCVCGVVWCGVMLLPLKSSLSSWSVLSLSLSFFIVVVVFSESASVRLSVYLSVRFSVIRLSGRTFSAIRLYVCMSVSAPLAQPI